MTMNTTTFPPFRSSEPRFPKRTSLKHPIPYCFQSQRGLGTATTTSTTTRTTKSQPYHEERLRRSLFSIPGSDARKIRKGQTLHADAVVLDLEDGVAWNQKDEARDLVRATLLDTSQTFGGQGRSSSLSSSELCVRINALDTGSLALQDLEAILPCPRLQTIVIPKVETASDIHFVSRMMDALCCRSSSNDDYDYDDENENQAPVVRILAAIESARGLLNLREIAAAAATTTHHHRRLDGLIFASEDYCADVEAIRTESAMELLFARSQLVVTAKAYGLQAIDMVHVQFRDLDALAVECQRGRELGFTGKQAIHPNQLDTIHQSFAPSSQDVEFAQRVVVAYEATTASGKGACEVNGMVVDQPVYKWAVKIMSRARAAGLLLDSTSESLS
jgi:citrate lyase subunit beta-like protein